MSTVSANPSARILPARDLLKAFSANDFCHYELGVRLQFAIRLAHDCRRVTNHIPEYLLPRKALDALATTFGGFAKVIGLSDAEVRQVGKTISEIRDLVRDHMQVPCDEVEISAGMLTQATDLLGEQIDGICKSIGYSSATNRRWYQLGRLIGVVNWPATVEGRLELPMIGQVTAEANKLKVTLDDLVPIEASTVHIYGTIRGWHFVERGLELMREKIPQGTGFQHNSAVPGPAARKSSGHRWDGLRKLILENPDLTNEQIAKLYRKRCPLRKHQPDTDTVRRVRHEMKRRAKRLRRSASEVRS